MRAAPPPARSGLTLFRFAAQADVFFFYIPYRINFLYDIKKRLQDFAFCVIIYTHFKGTSCKFIDCGLVVKRLRRRPLTAQSRVRFPAGSPKFRVKTTVLARFFAQNHLFFCCTPNRTPKNNQSKIPFFSFLRHNERELFNGSFSFCLYNVKNYLLRQTLSVTHRPTR